MAKEFGIYGYAMNLQNGRVFIVAEGGNEQLEKFISTIKQGPSYAIVKNIDIVERPATNEFSDFTIKY
jgi:acylphosphatase